MMIIIEILWWIDIVILYSENNRTNKQLINQILITKKNKINKKTNKISNKEKKYVLDIIIPLN